MKVATLISKLNKLNISHEIINNNGYNSDIKFTIGNKIFTAGIVNDKDTVQDFCNEKDYDNVNQEVNRRFFENFNQVLRYANR